MSKWDVKRHKPYTEIGLLRKKCIKCGKPATTQWQICSDSNNWRPLCAKCDIELNSLVLYFMEHPKAGDLILDYGFKGRD